VELIEELVLKLGQLRTDLKQSTCLLSRIEPEISIIPVESLEVGQGLVHHLWLKVLEESGDIQKLLKTRSVPGKALGDGFADTVRPLLTEI
jgi:hypothetical protein